MGQEPCLRARDGDWASSPTCNIWSPVGGSDLSEQVYVEKKETIDTSQSDKEAFENVCTQDSTPKSCSGTLGQVSL